MKMMAAKRKTTNKASTKGAKRVSSKRPPKSEAKGIKNRPSDRHMKMIDEYFECWNKTEACRRVGLKSAKYYAWRVFNRPDVRMEIARRRREAQENFEMDDAAIKQQIARLAMASPGKIMAKLRDFDYNLDCLTESELYCLNEVWDETVMEGTLSEVSDPEAQNVREVRRVKIKVESRLAALDKLCRIAGLYDDKLNVTGEMSLVERLQAGRKRASGKIEEEENKDE